jgi:UDP-3-O-[3-hydroxymyristoyl] glucosamine N-acyltransferase
MPRTLKDIAGLVNGEVIGDPGIKITGVAGIQDAQEGDITFLANPKYSQFLDKTRASAVIASRKASSKVKALILCDNPSWAFVRVVSFILPHDIKHPKGKSPQAVIAKDVLIGKDAAIGACSVIEEGVSIGDNSIIYPCSYIGRNSQIGSGTIIYSNVSIREGISIGRNVIIHSGAVIGSDGFGFVTVDGKHHKIPQSGTVVIEDDVEIGAGVTIDRARFDKTVIGQGTKLDNLVHIAHNVIIGKNCLIVAQVGISGSTTVGDNVILAGQVGVAGHVKIGDNSVVMAKSGISKSIPEGSVVFGIPAQPANEAKKIRAYIQRLPKMHETVKNLKSRIEQLEKKTL